MPTATGLADVDVQAHDHVPSGRTVVSENLVLLT